MLRYVKLPATQCNISTSETLNLAQKLGFGCIFLSVCLQLIMYYIDFILFFILFYF